ncbi:DUF1624 domain-containing protein [Flavihumibacter petaseus]|uniref:Heparan-alpha-glucosaminide N-acetyltransferase catalytic domain-containing protein n=1 Tax=Flavihumibacter petaseus NBRC 106054 TaxID=1220578 RepID=A0A0E9N5A4_9BACT|nr:heparan-alpha-glucosaminide N-acetyltransferase domain-containing protein [Flavihumibacter petaseus]GAO44861.1 hypothetical protein FPE01S_04_01040 [Flavihumibacter petaseus NBRC 106054]
MSRIRSIDFVRGLAMIIMALDHARDYFHGYSFLHNPADLAHTTPSIFFTRWITHFCAPVFVFLAGTSAFLSGQKKSKTDLSRFLLTRGLWLVVMELTVVAFGWFFDPLFRTFALQVIWALGWCMVLMAGLIWLPRRFMLLLGLALVFGHNLLDGIAVEGNTPAGFGWAVLHAFRIFHWGGATFLAAYPVMPWLGVMLLGYCFGQLYLPGMEAQKRKRLLLIMGVTGIATFVFLRWSNIYGDPSPWSPQTREGFTLLSFLNTTKYPPSLLYLLMTLSPMLLILAFTEQVKSAAANVVSTYGRVPFLYYILHIYIFHALGMYFAGVTGFGWQNMVITGSWVTDGTTLKGYGAGLPVVYAVWLIIVAALYPLCRVYDRYKLSHKHQWWLSYL